MEKCCSRRSLLSISAKGAASLAATAVFGSLFLSSCKKGCSPSTTSDAKNSLDNAKPATNDPDPKIASCPEETLSEQDKNVRSSLKYVDNSPIPNRRCDNCKLYTLPQGNAICGGCTIVPGPIHPKGHCTAWIARM